MSKEYQLSKLKMRHHEIARMAALGYAPQDIASNLGLNVQSVRQMLNGSTLLKAQVSALSDRRDLSVQDVRKDIEKLIPDALNALEEIVTNASSQVPDAVRFKAASHILAVHGIAPVTQSKHTVITAALPPEKVSQLIDNLKRNQERMSSPL